MMFKKQKREKVFAKTPNQLVDSLSVLKESRFIGVDTETSGLRPHSDYLWSIQLSDENGDFGVLIPINLYLGFEEQAGKIQWTPELHILKEFLQDESKTFIFHNAKFDLKFLKANGFEISNVYCTALTAKMLNAGTMKKNGLKDELKRRFGIELSKEERKDFYDGTFLKNHNENPLTAWSNALVDYALDDVFDLGRLMKAQLKDVGNFELEETQALEFDTQFPTAKAEYIGIGIDADGCREFQLEMSEKRDALNEEILAELEPVWKKYWMPIYQKDIAKYDAWKVKYDLVKSQTSKMKDGRKLNKEAVSLRAEIKAKCPFKNALKPKEKPPLKIRSSSALKITLSKIGIFVHNTAKETLEQMRAEHPILEKILEYKKYAKLSEFGELYETIDPVTGRIHPSYNQIVSTGRFSCSSPNLQQIPNRTDEGKRFRKLFQSRNGYKFVGADFTGIELVILAVLAKQKNLLQAINRGDDPHSFTISQLLKVSYELIFQVKENGNILDKELLVKTRRRFESMFDLPLLTSLGWSEADLVKWVKTLRDYMKTITYGVVYGLTKFGMAKKFHSSIESAESLIEEGFFSIYPNIAEYTRKSGETGYGLGYAETLLGRKRFFNKPKRKSPYEIAKELRFSLEKEGRNIDAMDDEEWADLLEEAIKVHNKEIKTQINAIKREAGNMPIQGCSADITKLAMVLFDSYLVENNFPDDEGTILVVHDEIVSEIKDERTELGASLLKKAMIEAGQHFLGKDVLIVVEPFIENFWKH